MERREFLAATGLAIGGVAALRAGTTGGWVNGAPAIDESANEWGAVREMFQLAPDFVHMAGFYLASHPTPVREAIERHRRGFDENPMGYHHDNVLECELRVHGAAGEYLGADAADVALTDSTTMGLGLLYAGLTLRPGQEILTTAHDHYATWRSLEYRAQMDGATIREIELYDDAAEASDEAIVDAIARAINAKTRVVAVTWVHSGTGVKLPIAAIAAVVAEANRGRAEEDRAILCVDGVHGLGVEDETVESLGCDFFVAGTHKWLFGPRGTGVIWGRKDYQSLLRNTIPPFAPVVFTSDREPTWGMEASPGGFHSFEHRWALAEAFELHMALGKARVAERIHMLNTQMKEGLARMRHVRLHTPRSERLSAGIVCFEVAGLRPEEVVARLAAKRIVASVTPYAVVYARLAPGILNSEEDVERVLGAVQEMG